MKIKYILPAIIVTLLASNLFSRFKIKNFDLEYNQQINNRKNLDAFLSSYYLMRISLIYYGSNESNDKLKERSKKLILNEFNNQNNLIVPLDQYFNNNELWKQMIIDINKIKAITKNTLENQNIKEIKFNIFEEIPNKRNYFKESANAFYEYIDQETKKVSAELLLYKKLENFSFYLNLIFTFVYFLKKRNRTYN